MMQKMMVALLGVLLLASCAAPLGEDCRGDTRGCSSGYYCCTEGKCGGGTCTTGCASDRDCPGDGYCESRMCWRPCASDRDCSDHLRCKSKDGRMMCRGD